MTAHEAEVGMFGTPDPDLERYLEIEKIDVARCFTARLGAGGGSERSELVGYCLMLVFPHPHYRTKLTAIADALYMSPDHRGTTALRFIAWVDGFCRKLGAVSISRAVNVRKDYSRLLMGLGYEKFETSYLRRL
jgi:alpha-D-ribose 1-methylphosphonate 5-triphosphate synthase subunit PhnG